MTETTVNTASANESVPVSNPDDVVDATQSSADQNIVANSQPATQYGSDEDVEDAETRRKRAEDSAEAARAQHEADMKFHNENPDSPIVRAANPDVGGE